MRSEYNAVARAVYFALAVWLLTCQSAQSVAQGSTSAPVGFSLVWSKPVPELNSLTVSPRGSVIGMLTSSGKIALWSNTSSTPQIQLPVPLWSIPGKTGDDVAITDSSGYALTFDPLNPIDTNLTGYNIATKTSAWKRSLDGALWDLVVSRDGRYVAAGTGSDSLYLYTLDSHPHYTTWKLGGIADSVAISPDETQIAVGEWNSSGVECFNMAGRRLWTFNGPIDRRFRVLTPTKETIMAVSWRNRQNSYPILYSLSTATGKLHWAYDLGTNSRNPVTLASSDGSLIVTSFERTMVRGKAVVVEQRLIAINSEGMELWEKGGIFFSPTLVSLVPDWSTLVVYDGQRTLYLIDKQGKEIARDQLSGQLVHWASTADGRLLLVDTSDNQLSLLRLT